MVISIETCLVVALAFAVFAAFTALGSSLVLGAGFERLRAGFEILKGQSGFFSESIHKLDKRVDIVEKQGRYFFEEIHRLEQDRENPPVSGDVHEDVPVETETKPVLINTKAADIRSMATARFWDNSEPDERRAHFQ